MILNKRLSEVKKMTICENCGKFDEKVETLTLCPGCFNRVSESTEFLFLENRLLKLILKNLIFKSDEKQKGVEKQKWK